MKSFILTALVCVLASVFSPSNLHAQDTTKTTSYSTVAEAETYAKQLWDLIEKLSPLQDKETIILKLLDAHEASQEYIFKQRGLNVAVESVAGLETYTKRLWGLIEKLSPLPGKDGIVMKLLSVYTPLQNYIVENKVMLSTPRKKEYWRDLAYQRFQTQLEAVDNAHNWNEFLKLYDKGVMNYTTDRGGLLMEGKPVADIVNNPFERKTHYSLPVDFMPVESRTLDVRDIKNAVRDELYYDNLMNRR